MIHTLQNRLGSATVEHGELHYEIAGQGAPLVLVHAGIADLSMWNAQYEALTQKYQVIRYDMRGYGKSEAATQAFSHHKDLNDLLTFLNIEKVHLLGSSMGGATIIDYALQYPEKALSLNLVATAVGGYTFEGPPPPALMSLFTALEQGNLEQATELAAQVWLDGPKRSKDQVSLELRNHIKTMSLNALKNMNPLVIQSSPLDPLALSRLHELKMPTQIIVGSHDDDSIIDIAKQISKKIKRSQKVVMNGVAHMLNMEKPEEFNQIILTFLDEIN